MVILEQIAGVAEVLDRVGFATIAAQVKQYVTEPAGSETVDTTSLQGLFLSLA